MKFVYERQSIRINSQSFPAFFLIWWGLLLLAVQALPPTVLGQTSDMADAFGRAGLKSIWLNSAGIDSGGEIADWYLSVNQSRRTSYIRIEAGRYSETVSQYDLDPFGKPFGLDGMVEYADSRKEVLQATLASLGDPTEVKLVQFTLPKSNIFILGSNNQLTALDADTGKRDWSVSFGTVRQPNIGLGASDTYLAAINGTTLYCFETSNGKLMWSKACRYAPIAPPVVSEEKIFVPLLNGRMEVFEIEKEGFNSYNIIGVGVPTSRPLITDDTVTWATRAGHMNVMPTEGKYERFMLYRLKANGSIRSTPVNRKGVVFTTSEDGFLYAIEEKSGHLLWQTSLGSEIFEPPFVFGDSVFVITNDRKLYKFNAETGESKWPQPVLGVGRYAGSSQERIYLTDGLRSLVVLNPETGSLLSRIQSSGEVRYILPNRKTDRLYFASNTGIIHCIHEINSPFPFFHGQDSELVAKPAESSDKVKPEAEKVNPFAEDPFATDRNADEDPFR
jgi:outer membrane protein assembly factor BamB